MDDRLTIRLKAAAIGATVAVPGWHTGAHPPALFPGSPGPSPAAIPGALGPPASQPPAGASALTRPVLLSRMLGALLLCALLVAAGARLAHGARAPRARQGVLDLSGYDLDRQAPVRLDGEWAFHWGQLLDPAAAQSTPTGYLDLPSYWNEVRIQGHPIGGTGCATLRLRILPGPGQAPLALRVFDLSSAYRLWVNGRMVASGGRVGRSAQEETADASLRMVSLPALAGPTELVLQVSNYHVRGGGVPASLQLGRADRVLAAQDRSWGLAMLFTGALLVMGIYHLALFAFRNRDRSPLCFGIYCLLWMGSILGSDASEWVIQLFLPGLSAAALFRLSQFCFFLTIPVGYQFFLKLYPQEFAAWGLRVWQVLGGAFALLALAGPTLRVSQALEVYYALAIPVVLYAMGALFLAWLRDREGAVYMLAGFLCLGMVGINDMLNDLEVIRTAFLIHIGMFVFILFQAVALSLRFARAFHAVEDLSAELGEKNGALEEEIHERARLEREIVHLSEEERRRISHALHDGLCQLLTGARLRCSALKRKWPMGQGESRELAELSSLLEESVDQAYELSSGLWPVDQDPRAVCASLSGLVARLSESSGVAMSFCQKTHCELCDNDPVTQLYHIAQEAIANALKHARPEHIQVTLDCLDRSTVRLTVQDDGIGRGAAQRSKGGLGLRIMAHRARMLGGELRIEDAPGHGTRVTCGVPCASQGRPSERVREAGGKGAV